MTAYDKPRYGAMALAAMFFAGTAYVLFEDVLRHGAPFTTAHVLTGLALIGTIAAGHYVVEEIRAWRIVSAAFLAVIFAAGTAYIVTASGARNAETAAAKVAAIEGKADERRHEMDLRDKAQAMLDAARKKTATACKVKKSDACTGNTATINVYEAAIVGHDAKLARMSPAPASNAGYAHAGRVLAALPFVTATPETITASLVLVMPFVTVLIAELGTITFGQMAARSFAMLRGRWRRPTKAETAQTSFGGWPAEPVTIVVDRGPSQPTPPAPTTPGPGKRTRRFSDRHEANKAKVVDFVREHRARTGTDPSPAMVRQATGLPRATAWRYQQVA